MQEDPLKEEMAAHPGLFAWEIPWTEKPDGLQSTGMQRVGRGLSENSQVHPRVLEGSSPHYLTDEELGGGRGQGRRT